MSRLLDPDFRYTSSAATSVVDTWKKHGFKPTTQAARNARVRRQLNAAPQVVAQTVRASGKSAVAEDTEGRGFESRPSAVAAPNVRELKWRAAK